ADPTDARALHAAVKQRRCADGYFVGNGGLVTGRYARDALEAAVVRLRTETHRAGTGREEVGAHDDALIGLGDWFFPIANPYRANAWHPQDACGYGVHRNIELHDRLPAGMPLVLAETGLPTEGPPGENENYQRAFFFCLETRFVPFEY